VSCACANIALMAFAGSLALDAEIPADADWPAFADVALDGEDEELAPNNVRISAADNPP